MTVVLDVGSAFRSSPLWQELAAIAFDGKPWPESQAKRHHFVPRFLLRGFLGDGARRLYQLHVATGRPQAVAPDAAASRRRFYELPPAAPGRPGDFEAWLSVVESHSAPALERLLGAPHRHTHADRATLSLLFALFDGRTPEGNARSAQFSKTTMRMLMTGIFFSPDAFAEEYHRTIGEAPAEEIEAFRQRTLKGLRDGTFDFAHPRHRGFELALRASGDLAQEIFASPWALLGAPVGRAFVTSDRGLAMHDPSPRFPWSAQAWRSSPDAQVSIPLSRRWLLVIVPPDANVEPAQTRVVEADAPTVDELNLRTYGWAGDYIYGESQQVVTELHRFARRHPRRVVRPRPQCQVVMVPADPEDDSLARENARRGWPPQVCNDGQICDYVVIGPGDNPVEVTERLFRLAQERGGKGIRVERSSRPPAPRKPTSGNDRRRGGGGTG